MYYIYFIVDIFFSIQACIHVSVVSLLGRLALLGYIICCKCCLIRRTGFKGHILENQLKFTNFLFCNHCLIHRLVYLIYSLATDPWYGAAACSGINL